ncbi:MAG TPA: minor capsid protein [Streptosporangiaceae bacterium]
MTAPAPGWLDGIARYLAAQVAGLAYRTDGTPYGVDETGISLWAIPASPDTCMVLTPYGGPAPDTKLGYNTPRLQARFRGPPGDPDTPAQLDVDVFDVLQGLGPVTLPGGVRLISCEALQADPGYLGQDGNRRHELTRNYQLEHRAITAHRQ